jgi:hypothetical protein
VPSPDCKAEVQEVPTVVLELSSGFLELYVILMPVGLDVFCELHPEASTELHSKMQNSHFHHTSEIGLSVFPENPKLR